MLAQTPTAWLLATLLSGCGSSCADRRETRNETPSASAVIPSALPVRAKGCLSGSERGALSLQRTWWSPAGLGYCIGRDQVDRCIELKVMSNSLVPFAEIPIEARSPPPVPEHPLRRSIWGVKSGVKVCDARREGQLDYCCVIETSDATRNVKSLDSADSSARATKQRLLTADISGDRKHFAFIGQDNALTIQELKPKGTDRFTVKTIYHIAVGNQPVRQLWWAGARIALRVCGNGSCTLSVIDPMTPKAVATATGIAIGHADFPLHPITDTDWVVVSESGEMLYFFDFGTGLKSSTLTLQKKSSEGVWSGKSGPFELALVYGKPNLGDVVRVDLQQRVVSTVNTASCD